MEYIRPRHTRFKKLLIHFGREGSKIKILFLTVAHPELNPIEVLWSKVKRQVASTKKNVCLYTVEELTREAAE